jgi:hypothetical protein
LEELKTAKGRTLSGASLELFLSSVLNFSGFIRKETSATLLVNNSIYVNGKSKAKVGLY